MSYPALTAGQILTADGLNVPAAVVRLVKGKVFTASTADTNSSSTTDVAVTSANIQNVPVIATRAYRATFVVEYTGTVVADRIQYRLWQGTVGGTQLGGEHRFKIVATTTQYTTATIAFVWEAPNTETIGNLNLSVARFTGSGQVTARVAAAAYLGLVEDLGPASAISGL